MKKYSTSIAARKIVGKRLALGTSRHQCKAENNHKVCGVSTAHSHTRSLKVTGDWLHTYKGKHLENLSEEDAAIYLSLRAMTVGQSAVDLDRQALNFHLFYENPIPFITSTIRRVEMWRGCSSDRAVSVCRLVATSRCLLLPFTGVPRFHIPLIKPDVQISRIRLSDKTSRLRPRLLTPPRAQTYESKVPVQVREWIAPALSLSGVVFAA